MGKINNLMKVISMVFFGVLALTAVAMPVDYPNKPIQIIVPSPPGGTTDIAARVISQKVSSIIGQPVIVVNKPGGGGSIAAKIVASAEPDGYNVLAHWMGVLLVPILNPGIGFKFEDFTPICKSVANLFVIAVKEDSHWKTLGDLITDVKKNPGKFTYSTGGFGSGYHFCGEHFKIETGTDIVHIPMEGDMAAVTALLGGHVSMTFSGIGSLSAYLKAGNLRALAQMTPGRLKDFPGIPSIGELGYPSLTSNGWYGYFLPAKTPRGIVDKLGKAFEITLKDKQVIEKIENTGMVVDGLFLEEATRFFQNENKRWSEVAKKAKMVEGRRK